MAMLSVWFFWQTVVALNNEWLFFHHRFYQSLYDIGHENTFFLCKDVIIFYYQLGHNWKKHVTFLNLFFIDIDLNPVFWLRSNEPQASIIYVIVLKFIQHDFFIFIQYHQIIRMSNRFMINQITQGFYSIL